jgi:thiosulfate dehydrogenase [quinone] large subunit
MESETTEPQTVPTVRPGTGLRSSLVAKARTETFPVWVLLPLRAFLGFTFVFAGLQKLSNRQFFTAGAPGSIQEQLQASHLTSPVKFLITPALHAPVLFGIVIALAEVAVGLGVALGLFGRIAAGGGMVLSLLFFLTVSFNTWPYYFGSDIVFLFAWTPLLLAGSGPISLDAVLEQRTRHVLRATQDAPAEADVGRRMLVRQLGAASVVAAFGAFIAGAAAAIGRAASSNTAASGGTRTPALSVPTPTTGGSTATTGGSTATTGGSTSTRVSTPSGTRIGLASSVPVGGAASFTNPTGGSPAYVVQPSSGKFVAYSAICTHEGCTVAFFSGSPLEFRCPCHGSVYNAVTGDVIQGPAVVGLASIAVAEGPSGELFAT